MKNLLFIVLMVVLTSIGCTYNPHVVIVTNMGEIEIELDAENAPLHTENFLKLVRDGFYTGTTFHRVVQGILIQGGDPNSKNTDPGDDGTGGPGYMIAAEFNLPHVRGSIAAARLGDQMNPEKKSNGSQFYICIKDLPMLDKAGYTVFGRVINGMDVVDKIGKVRTNAREMPQRRIVMERVYEN